MVHAEDLSPPRDDDARPVVVDVRERDEFDAAHVPGAIHVPLSSFSSMAPGIFAQLTDRPLVLMCRSGTRAKQALDQARALGLREADACIVHEGGMLRWQSEGKPLEGAGKLPLPLLRQVQIVAGTSVAAFSTLGVLVHPAFTAAAGLMGAGLLFAGVTGSCALASLLAKAPWNRRRAAASSCVASG